MGHLPTTRRQGKTEDTPPRWAGVILLRSVTAWSRQWPIAMMDVQRCGAARLLNRFDEAARAVGRVGAGDDSDPSGGARRAGPEADVRGALAD
jgi:hypothetical protein